MGWHATRLTSEADVLDALMELRGKETPCHQLV
jgi:hypothetical protein